jgi:hypothetical protein
MINSRMAPRIILTAKKISKKTATIKKTDVPAIINGRLLSRQYLLVFVGTIFLYFMAVQEGLNTIMLNYSYSITYRRGWARWRSEKTT